MSAEDTQPTPAQRRVPTVLARFLRLKMPSDWAFLDAYLRQRGTKEPQ